MIITLKTIGAAFDYQDGLLSEADLKEAQKHNFITRLPSLLEYMGYSLNCGTHFAGPVYGIRSYLDWTSRSGVGALVAKPSCILSGAVQDVYRSLYEPEEVEKYAVGRLHSLVPGCGI